MGSCEKLHERSYRILVDHRRRGAGQTHVAHRFRGRRRRPTAAGVDRRQDRQRGWQRLEDHRGQDRAEGTEGPGANLRRGPQCILQSVHRRQADREGSRFDGLLQGGRRQEGPRRRPDLALQGRQQLLRLPHESAGGQLSALQGCGWQAHPAGHRRRNRCQGGDVAHDPRRPRRRPDSLLLQRQEAARSEGRHLRRGRQDRPVDQSRRRDII